MPGLKLTTKINYGWWKSDTESAKIQVALESWGSRYKLYPTYYPPRSFDTHYYAIKTYMRGRNKL